MPYVGRDLQRGNYLKLDDISSSFDGSTTTFNLTSGGNAFFPGSAFSIIVSLGGVVQEPEAAFQIDRSQIIFATAPSSNDDFFCIVQGVSLGIGVPGHNTVNNDQLAKPLSYGDYFRWDSANNRVGINTLLPSTALDVVGDASFSGNVAIGGTLTYEDVTNIDAVGIITARSGIIDETLTTGHVVFTGTGGRLIGEAELFYDTSNNRLGIGTHENFGDATLSVEGVTTLANTDQTIMVRDRNPDDAVGRGGNIGFGAYVGGTMRTLAGIGALKTNAGSSFNGDLALYTRVNGQGNLSERIRIRGSDGHIGINTITPSKLVTIKADAPYVRLEAQDSSDKRLDFEVTNTGIATISANQSSQQLSFKTTSGEAIRIDSAGLVGIGTDDPAYQVDIVGDGGLSVSALTNSTHGQLSIVGRNSNSSVSAISRLKSYPEGSSNQSHLAVETRNSSNSMVEALRISATQQVGVGTITPKRKVDIVGNSLLVRPTADNVSSSGNGSAVNNSIIIRMPYGENPASTNHGGARFGIQFTGANNTTDVPSLNWGDDPTKSASIYGVSEDNLGYNRKVGLVFYTSEFDATQEERLRITNDGKVGMGLTSSSASGICDPDGNALLIRAASTVGTKNGHIMLTGDGADTNEGPQIVFSESGSGSNWAGAYIGHQRKGAGSQGDLIFATRRVTGDVDTVPAEALRIDSGGRVLIGNNDEDIGDGTLQVYTSDRKHPAIRTNSANANGYPMISDSYASDESQVNIGIMYSSAKLVLSTSVKPSDTADNTFISSQDTFSARPCALTMSHSGVLQFLNTSTNATTTTDSAVSLTERLSITKDGEMLLGTGGADRPIAAQRFNSASGWSGTLQIEKQNPNTGNNNVPIVAITAWNGANEQYTGGISFNRSNNNTNGTHGAVNANQQLGNIAFNGSDGTNFIQGAEIFAIPDQTFATNDGPASLVFATTPDGTSEDEPQERLRIRSGGQVNIGGDYTQTTYTMKVTGSFAATTKSFVIDHPTKENHTLRYACLEGPENSVYVRGKTSDSVIELPDYWVGLVHDDSITVNLTPIGNHKVWVESINNNSVTIGSDGSEYFYTVFAERKDVDKLEVEVAK